MASNQKVNELINLYVQTYSEKYNRAPEINRFRIRWGFKDMIEDLGHSNAQKVIAYFFEVDVSGHSVYDLLRSYDELYTSMIEAEEDERVRHQLREETRLRVREWEESLGDQRRTGD